MKKMMRTTLAVGGLFALACSGNSEEDGPTNEPPPPPSTEEPVGEAAPTLEPGEVPYDFPRMSSQGRDGQFALVPSREFLDRAIADDGQGTFIYYGATITTAGSPESTIKSLAGTTFAMPNAMIIPISSGQKAKKGDILLGHWESGSGLQRAIMVGGTSTEPVVRYLDMDYDNPSGWGQKEDTWQADRFSVLSEPWQVGTTAACGESNDRKHGILTAVSGGRLLVSGFAGSISAYSRDECVALSPKPTVAAGDTVWVPVVGSYTEGQVSRVDAEIGRVFVTYDWGGQQKEGAFGLMDVAPDFVQPTGTVVTTPEPVPGEEAHPGAGRTRKVPKGTRATGPRGKSGKSGKSGGGGR
ncbi:MAG: hypothetical protein ACI8RZ_004210 [Myxococcota bacterium]|jgi:hypothetical protein